MLIPGFVQCVTGLLLARSWLVPLVTGMLLACSWLVPLVTDLFLAYSACYWLVPLVPCFSNVVSTTDPKIRQYSIFFSLGLGLLIYHKKLICQNTSSSQICPRYHLKQFLFRHIAHMDLISQAGWELAT